MPVIRKKAVIDILNASGLEYEILSDRLFRVKTRHLCPNDQADTFVEICCDKLALNSQILSYNELENRLKEITTPDTTTKPRRKRVKKTIENEENLEPINCD